MKFKVGDKVTATRQHDGNFAIINKNGTVVRAYNDGCLVRFNANIHGHGDGKRCWNIPHVKLRLVREKNVGYVAYKEIWNSNIYRFFKCKTKK
jgi:hypothetical protein